MTAVLTPTPALVVDELSLSFGGNHVLQQIALRLTPGEITGLIGPNGAGKTSFFNCLTGLYAPKGGAIRFGERRIERVAPADRAELGFSRSFQHVALCPDLSIAENVMIGVHRQSTAGWLDAFLPLPGGRAERERNRAQARRQGVDDQDNSQQRAAIEDWHPVAGAGQ